MKNFIKTFRVLTIIFLVFGTTTAYSQNEIGVSIGDTLRQADPSAILDLFSETKGFLAPRMTTAERDSIANPATGLIVFDTDLNAYLYYRDGWKGFGPWIRHGNDIYYNEGGVVISNDTIDTEGEFDLFHPLTIRGTSGILSAVEGDTVPETPYFASNVFLGEFNTNSDFGTYANMVVSASISELEERPTAVTGISASSENIGYATIGISADAIYSGSSAVGLDDEGDVPITVGLMTSSVVTDPDAIAMSAGALAQAKSDHQGMNIGIRSEAYSETTRMNVGIMSVVNVIDPEEEEEEEGDTTFSNFPERLTIASYSYNHYADSTDFNVFASGNAKSYFEGNVGIGTLNPQATLDIAGGVNASVYLVDGDTLALNNLWSQSGDDLYYDHGNVHIGKIIPGSTANFNVAGSFYAVSDTTASFPLSVLIVSKDSALSPTGLSTIHGPGVGMLLADTSSITGNMDTTFISFGMGMGTGTNGSSSNWIQLSDSIINFISLEGWEEENEGIAMSSLTIAGASSRHTDLLINPNLFSLLSSKNGVGTSSLNMSATATYLTVGYAGDGVRLDADITGFSATTFGTDTMQLVVKENGVGIGTDSPDTELHVDGNIKQRIYSENVSNPPTDTQLDGLFTSPISKGDGWTAYVKDTDSDNLYQIMVWDEEWYIVSTVKAQ